MRDPVAFLRARLDEDRDRADALAEKCAEMGPVIEGVTENKLYALMQHTAVRMLREVALWRAIIAEYEDVSWPHSPEYYGALWFALWHRTAVYSDHPDHDPEWST